MVTTLVLSLLLSLSACVCFGLDFRAALSNSLWLDLDWDGCARMDDICSYERDTLLL